MSETFYELLISLVKNRRLLWDMKSKNYHNRLLVDREWNRIAADLETPKETVKAKWKNLRDKFRKELMKIPVSHSGDDGDQAFRYTGTWCHFDAMLFMKSIFASRQTEGSVEAPETENLYDTLNAQLADSHEEESQSTSVDINKDSNASQILDSRDLNLTTSSSVQKASGKKRTSLQEELDDFEKSLPDKDGPTLPIKIHTSKKRKVEDSASKTFEAQMLDFEARKLDLLQKETDDDDINFFKSLLPFVRPLPSLNKLFFRTQVQNILMNEISKLNSNNQQYLPFNPSTSSSSTASPSPQAHYNYYQPPSSQSFQ